MPDHPPLPLAALPDLVDRLAHRLVERHFPEMARALRTATPSLLVRWRERSLLEMPELGRLDIRDFENSVGELLDAVADALESRDPERIRRIIVESPAHGLCRFVQSVSAQSLLAEERILRGVIVLELRRELSRPLTADEAASLHELLDLMGEHTILALIRAGREEHDCLVRGRMIGMHRLAGLGTLVAGVAHDAANLMLPLRMCLEHLEASQMSPEVRDDVTTIALICTQFQNSIVNLRWLSVDSLKAPADGRGGEGAPSSLPPDVSMSLGAWAAEVARFYRRVLPHGIELRFDIPADLPAVRANSAALSQTVFNLVRNAQQAIMSRWESEPAQDPRGLITVRAAHYDSPGLPRVELTIQDDGPGMSPDILRRSAEPYFTTREGGTGLGLALVRALVTGWGGTITFHSPLPDQTRGTAVILTIMTATAS